MIVDFGETYSSDNYEIRDTTGALAAAGTVTVTVTLPDATTATPTVANPSTGIYNFDYLTTQTGRHPIVVHATGGVLGSIVRRWTDEFDVRPADPGIFISLNDVKTHLNKSGLVTTDNEELRGVIQAACARIEFETGPVARRTITSERQRHEYGRASVWLHETPVISVTTVTPVATGGTAVTVADLDIDPSGQISFKDGYTRFPAGLYLWTYIAGRVIIPAPITHATKELTRHLWLSQRGASGLPLQGGEEFGPIATLPYALPNGVRELLAPYMRAAAVA